MPDGYLYDVFLSYKRNTLIEPWVKQYFLPHLRNWLEEERGGTKIFFDQECIDWGEKWKDRLREGLSSSKLLLAVCSPSYFRSPWCSFEWDTFILRERVAGNRQLIIPITHNGRKHFPQIAKDLQAMDFSDCVSLMPAFSNDPKAMVFERKIRQLVPTIARVLKAAPDFQSSWPTPSFTQDVRIIPGLSIIEPDDLSDVSAQLLTL